MNHFTLPLFFLLLILGTTVQAQNAEYDVRFVNQAECDNNTVLADIEIKVADGRDGFFMSEQNYRFSYTKGVLDNPTISDQGLVGIQFGTGGPSGFALFAQHNLNGSLDTVVSYNVALDGGDGWFLTSDEWVYIGQVSLDLLDPDACYDLKWHDVNFPRVYIGERGDTERYDATGVNYLNAGECSPCSLPMEIVKFKGEANDCAIDIHWETASETNTSYVMLQRSNNGVDYEDVARIQAAGNSTETQYYNYRDEAITSLNNYYRLKQVDMDGSYRMSEVIQVRAKCYSASGIADILDIYPNPVNGQDVNVQIFSANNTSTNVSVLDFMGRTLAQYSFELTEGTNILNIPTQSLASGTYYIQIESQNWHSQAQKFVKLN